MKIKFFNLGAIIEAELDLRPLTLIIGPNNTNKTYIAYSIYGLWQNLRRSLLRNPNFQTFANSVLIKLDKEFIQLFRNDLTNSIKDFVRDISVFFQDSSNKIFSKTSFEVNISNEEIIEIVKKSNSNNFDLDHVKTEFNVKFNESDSFILASTGSGKTLSALRFLFSINFLDHIFPIPFLLPAERNAFIITYKMLSNRRYKFLKDAQRGLLSSGENVEHRLDLMRELGDIRYPQPTEDFLDFLADVDLEGDAVIKPSEKNEFQNLADDIELKVQGNHKIRLKPTKFGSKEIKVNLRKGFDIDLYNASSSIKQLTPLLLYLRYRARENDLLIIDEPELNLHPESQAKLLETLAILVNLGVKVLLTTHSPYFMAHLNNLVSGNTDAPEILKEQATSLYLNDPRAFLPMDKVSAYEMKDNTLVSLKDEDHGIRWDTLSDVSADIQQKFFEISEKGATVSHGKKR